MLEAWHLKQDLVAAEEEKLREDVRALNDARRAAYFREFNSRVKDPDTYAVLNWFFLAGLHHFYLGKYVRGLVNLLVMIVGFILLFLLPAAGIALITGIILAELPALFRSQIVVANYNTRLGRQILVSTGASTDAGVRQGATSRAH